jgi:hypothetical protein
VPKLRMILIGLLILAVGVSFGWLLLPRPIHTSTPSSPPPSTTKNAAPPSREIIVKIPPGITRSTAKDDEISVKVPDVFIDKFRPPPTSGFTTILQYVWPGLAALIGTLVGGLVTLGANRQKNKHDENESINKRKQAIRDRGFNACVELFKAGRLVLAEADALWKEVYVAEDASAPRVVELTTSFRRATRDWFSAGAVALLAVPPAAKAARRDYSGAVAAFLTEADEWLNDLVAGITLTEAEKEARASKSERLHEEAQDKRDQFLDLVETLLYEGAYP